MRFASLILALAAANAASAYYLSTFFNLDAATEAPDYLTYILVSSPEGKALALYSFVRR